MARSSINRVILTGNLTADPDMSTLPSGTILCRMRIASNTRRKDAATGEWIDKPNYFDVAVWGAQGENCARYLTKGRGVAVDGRLDWHEYDAKDGSRRQTVEIVADTVQFLDTPEVTGDGSQDRAEVLYRSAADDDIPF